MSKPKPEPRFPREFPGVHYYDHAEEEAALRVIRQRSPFRYYGASFLAEADSFEKEFAARLDRRYAQAVSSGTNGLLCAMVAFGIGPGDEVVMPGFFWVSTVGAVVRAGAVPVLVEIDDSFTIDPADLVNKITPRTRLILPVHMCGCMTDMRAVMEIADRHGIPVLEDCAQANGATLDGHHVGTFGQMAMFSFQMNKNMTAGEGGVLVTDDEALYLRANAAHDLGVPWSGGMPVNDSEHACWGAGARMSELTAAVLRVQLRKLDRIVANMRASKQRIQADLADLTGIQFRRVHDPAGDTGPFIIAMLAEPQAARRLAGACADAGLTCSYLPDYGLHIYYNVKSLVEKRSNCTDGFPWTHPANAPLIRNYDKGTLPKTDDLLDRSIVLAVPSNLTPEQETDYIQAVRQAYQESGL